MATMSPVDLEVLPLEGLFCTLEQVAWAHEKGYHVLVPCGFYFNGASVPKWCWPMLEASPPRLVIPGLIHDYLVREGAVVHWDASAVAEPLTADFAAEAMDDVMEWAEIDPDDREKIVMALKVTAAWYWQKKPVDWAPV